MESNESCVFILDIKKIADSYIPLIHSDRDIVNGESSTLMPHLFCHLKM